jgi:hypothetical protein
MGKVTWEGWQTDTKDAAQPTGPIVTSDGKTIITLEGEGGRGTGVRRTGPALFNGAP